MVPPVDVIKRFSFVIIALQGTDQRWPTKTSINTPVLYKTPARAHKRIQTFYLALFISGVP